MWMQKAQRITPWINYWHFILFLTLHPASVFSVLSYLLLLLLVLLLYQPFKSITCMHCGQDKSHWEVFWNRMASFRLELLTFHCCWFHFAGWCFPALICLGNKIIVFMLLGGAFQLWFVWGTRSACWCCWVVLSSSDLFGDKIIVFMLLGGAFQLWFVWGTRSLCSCCWVVLFSSDLFGEQDHCVHVAGWCFAALICLGTRSLCSCCWVVLSSSDLFWLQDHCC